MHFKRFNPSLKIGRLEIAVFSKKDVYMSLNGFLAYFKI